MDKTSDTECVFTDRQCVFRGTPAVRQKPDAASFCCEFKQVFVPVSVCPCAWNFRTWRESFVFIPFKCLGPFVYLFYWYWFFLRHPRFLTPTSVFFFVFRTFDRSIDYRLCDCKCDKLQMNCSLGIDHGVWGDIILTGQAVSHTRKHPHHDVESKNIVSSMMEV